MGINQTLYEGMGIGVKRPHKKIQNLIWKIGKVPAISNYTKDLSENTKENLDNQSLEFLSN